MLQRGVSNPFLLPTKLLILSKRYRVSLHNLFLSAFYIMPKGVALIIMIKGIFAN